MGHSVKLMTPQFVKPYVKTNKNNAAAFQRRQAGFTGYQQQGRLLPARVVDSSCTRRDLKRRAQDGERCRLAGPLARFGLQRSAMKKGLDSRRRF